MGRFGVDHSSSHCRCIHELCVGANSTFTCKSFWRGIWVVDNCFISRLCFHFFEVMTWCQCGLVTSIYTQSSDHIYIYLWKRSLLYYDDDCFFVCKEKRQENVLRFVQTVHIQLQLNSYRENDIVIHQHKRTDGKGDYRKLRDEPNGFFILHFDNLLLRVTRIFLSSTTLHDI